MLFSSSKRARNSTKTTTSFPFSAALINDLTIFEFFATRYNVILILATLGSRLASSSNLKKGDMDSNG